jgi:hypothetical protein
VRLALYGRQPLDQITQSDLVTRAFAEEMAEYWPVEYELLAVIAEQMSALLLAFLRVHGAKNVGEPLRIPRPATRVADDEPKAISFREFARQLG